MSNKETTDEPLNNVSEKEHELALQALGEFNQKNYTACLQSISKLEDHTQDFKVLHNKYVIEYCKSDLRKTEVFQKNLTGLFNQFGLHLDRLDDVDHCVAYYNCAVLKYHSKQYTDALNTMDKVYKFIEPMEEKVGRQAGLLLVELHILVRQIDKAKHLITYLHNHALNQVTPTMISTTKVSAVKHRIDKEPKPSEPISEATAKFLKQLEKYRIQCDLLKRNLKVTRADLALLPNENADTLFMLANQEYLAGDFLKATKLLTSIPVNALRIKDHGESSTVMFYNNMGVLHHAMGKPNLSCYYYQQALKEDSNNSNGDGWLHAISASRYHELMYNMGISLLAAGKAEKAFECLIVAVRRYHRNARLWLRLAECCIAAHKEGGNQRDFDVQRAQRDIVKTVLDSKDYQRVVLSTGLGKDKKYSTDRCYAVPMATLDFATLCLRNASALLPAATTVAPPPIPPAATLLLMPGVTAPPHADASANLSASSPSSPLDGRAVADLKCAILAASAYVATCLGDYVVALEQARELLAQPALSGAHRLLGHLYAAESLILLDKTTEALELLNPEQFKDISLECPSKDGDAARSRTKPPAKWFPNSMGSALAVLQYNVAVVKTTKGLFEQAAALLSQIWQSRSPDCKVPAQTIMLFLYIELSLGHTEVAKSLIKQYALQHRFHG